MGQIDSDPQTMGLGSGGAPTPGPPPGRFNQTSGRVGHGAGRGTGPITECQRLALDGTCLLLSAWGTEGTSIYPTKTFKTLHGDLDIGDLCL